MRGVSRLYFGEVSCILDTCQSVSKSPDSMDIKTGIFTRARPNDLETFSSFADVMAVYLKGGYRYNEIYKVQIPNITPHVCRHMYCSNQAKAGMNPKTLQYLMGHSDIGVTMNVYTHLGLEDAEEELRKMEDFRKAQEAIEKKEEKPVTQKAFKVV